MTHDPRHEPAGNGAKGRLSAADAGEGAALLAELMRAQLPLDEGLAALADELPRGKLPRALREVARRLNAGTPLDAAWSALQGRLPEHLRGLITSALRSGGLGEALEQYADRRRVAAELRRKVWLTLLYPTLLLAGSLLLVLLCARLVVPGLAELLLEFDVDLPLQTEFLLWLAADAQWILWTALAALALGIVALRLSGDYALLCRVVGGLPGIGPLWRWIGLAEWSRLLSLLLRNDLPLPQALRLAGEGVSHAGLAAASRSLSARIEAGTGFAAAVAAEPDLPPTLAPIVDWGERNAALPDSLQAAGDLFEGRVKVQTTLLETVLPMLSFLVVSVTVLFLVSALFSVLILTIESLGFGTLRQSAVDLGAVADHFAILLLGAAVLVALRLISAGRRETGRDAGHLVLNTIGWMLSALGLLSVLQLCLGDGLGVSFWFASLVVFGMALSRRRSAERNALVWVLAIAAERGMPLPAATEAFADEWGGRYAQKVRRLADLLRAGFSLPDALRRQRRTLSDSGLVAAATGHDAGALGPSLREAAAAGSLQEPLWQAVASKLFYLYFAAWTAIGIGTALMIKIAPAMEQIASDFDMELPAVTEFVFLAAEWVAHTAILWLPFYLLFGVALPIYLVLYYVGWVHWRIPLLDRLTLRLETAGVLRSLALFAERGRPLLAALDSLSLVYPRRWIRRRLERAYNDVMHGEDWCESLESQGLVRGVDVAVLRSAERVGNLPWALRATAAGNERRVVYRLQALLQVAFLLVLAAIAVAAAVFVTAFFLPLIEMMGRMA